MTERKLILNGKVAMMDESKTVLDDGYIYIMGNRIVRVSQTKVARPAGFNDVDVISTGGTIFPGLIEMHNHLPYNILPMWEVDRKYDHRGQWRSAQGKRQNISTPMTILGRKKGLGPAIARYVEAKCILAGVTTTQGITLFSAPGIGKHFKGVTRNVERPLDLALPKASTKVPDITADKLESFHVALKNSSCFLLHLSEGLGDFARKHFLVLQKEDGTWALESSLTGIHATGLAAQDFDLLAGAGASIAWSPLSNLLLYGETTDVTAAKQAGVNIVLGSDWSPSGSKNLLAELKIAKSVSDNQGGLFSNAEITQMATLNAARALKWDTHLGSLEDGKIADLFVVSGRKGDPYARLLAAKETQISLVMVDGIARVGRPSLFRKLETPTEEIRINGARRALMLTNPPDEMAFNELTLAAAKTMLSDALGNLPQLQVEYSEQQERLREARENGAILMGAFANQSDGWFLFSDEEDHDDALSELGLFDYGADQNGMLMGGGGPVIVTKMKLDSLTSVSDRNYYKRIKAAHNVPNFIRTDPALA